MSKLTKSTLSLDYGYFINYIVRIRISKKKIRNLNIYILKKIKVKSKSSII